MFDLRSWLQRRPKPAKLRIKDAEGEWRTIELTGGRHRWNEVEATLKTSEAVAVECLDPEGHVLRAHKLVEDDGDDFEGDAKGGDKSLSKAMREQAAMLDAYGRRMNEAFQRGSESASMSQDKLVNLVEVLTQHLTLAITNLHNISTNYAQVVAAQGGGEEGNGPQALMGLLAAMTGKLPMATADTNGKAKK